VLLLMEGKYANTVVNVEGTKIFYQPTEEAIKRREVDTEEITLFEALGTCFGRKPCKFEYVLKELKGPISRHV